MNKKNFKKGLMNKMKKVMKGKRKNDRTKWMLRMKKEI